jgi:hypothetical protein
MQETVFLEPNKTTDSNRFYVLASFWSGLLSLAGLVISIIVSLSAHRFNVLFAFVLNLPFPLLAVLVSYKCTNWIFSFIKNGGQKRQIIVFSIFLFILKYIIVVAPLIIGLIIDGALDTTIFNPFALVVGVLIYPTTTLIVQ